MGSSLDTPINFDVLLINTFITQLPVVFGELGRISLAGVFERRFVVSIATFELWFRETIVVFLGMIWGTDRCFVNNTLYSHAVSFQRAVFRFITVAGTWWGDSLFFRLQDLMVMTTDDGKILTTSATYTLYIYIYVCVCVILESIQPVCAKFRAWKLFYCSSKRRKPPYMLYWHVNAIAKALYKHAITLWHVYWVHVH